MSVPVESGSITNDSKLMEYPSKSFPYERGRGKRIPRLNIEPSPMLSEIISDYSRVWKAYKNAPVFNAKEYREELTQEMAAEKRLELRKAHLNKCLELYTKIDIKISSLSGKLKNSVKSILSPLSSSADASAKAAGLTSKLFAENIVEKPRSKNEVLAMIDDLIQNRNDDALGYVRTLYKNRLPKNDKESGIINESIKKIEKYFSAADLQNYEEQQQLVKEYQKIISEDVSEINFKLDRLDNVHNFNMQAIKRASNFTQ